MVRRRYRTMGDVLLGSMNFVDRVGEEHERRGTVGHREGVDGATCDGGGLSCESTKGEVDPSEEDLGETHGGEEVDEAAREGKE